MVRGFIDALTRGGLGGTPRPIEMHSHDPLRYSTKKNVYKIIFFVVGILNSWYRKPLIYTEISVFV